MKKIDIDDELYQYIASNTQSIGESASTILRRLLNLSGDIEQTASDNQIPSNVKEEQVVSEQLNEETNAVLKIEQSEVSSVTKMKQKKLVSLMY